MTPAQATIVQRSFSSVLPCADTVARVFYRRLFALEPGLRPLFKSDPADQRRKLVLTLGSVVGQLHDTAAVLPGVRALAVRHVGYGVEERHYSVVGRALLDALADVVPAFDQAQRDAWEAVYAALSSAMIDAARAAPPPRSADERGRPARAGRCGPGSRLPATVCSGAIGATVRGT